MRIPSLNNRMALDFLLKLFKLWTAFLVVLSFVLFIAFQLDSMILVMPVWEIVVNSAAMLIFLFLLSAVLSCLSWVIVLVLRPYRAAVYHVCIVAVTALCVYDLVRTAKMWTLSVLRITMAPSYPVERAIFCGGLVLVVIVVCLKRSHVYDAVERTAHRVFRPAMAVVLASVGVLTWWMSTHQARGGCISCGEVAEAPAPPDRNVTNAPSGRPDVILLTFDALSAEDMSLYGYRLHTTPNLEALASESFVFDKMVANSNYTRPTTTSLLTGLYPGTHKLNSDFSGNAFLKDDSRTLPWVLRQAGYRTLAVVNNYLYAHPYMNGTFRSFDLCPWETFDSDTARQLDPSIPIRIHGTWLSNYGLQAHFWISDWAVNFQHLWPASGRSETQNAFPIDYSFKMANKILDSAQGPRFMWIHLLPPHEPYLPPEPFKFSILKEKDFSTTSDQRHITGYYSASKQADVDKMRLRYDEFITYADHEFGRFVRLLKETGEWDRAIVIVSADHGESFEKGHIGHGGRTMYKPVMHIPLIIHVPGSVEGKRIESPAEQVDIAPTILDLLGMEIPEWMEGESLNGAMRGEAGPTKAKFYMELSEDSNFEPLRDGTIAVIKDGYKLILHLQTNKVRLYDLAQDPDESVDLSEKDKTTADTLKQLIMTNIVERY